MNRAGGGTQQHRGTRVVAIGELLPRDGNLLTDTDIYLSDATMVNSAKRAFLGPQGPPREIQRNSIFENAFLEKRKCKYF